MVSLYSKRYIDGECTVRRIGCYFALAALLLVLKVQAAEPPPGELLVFAASSLTDALNEIGTAYERDQRQTVKFSYAASSALAHQIESGARADVFFSADTDWMDYLQKAKLIDTATRHAIVGNALVLVAPADSGAHLKIAPGFPLAAALGADGHLSTGDPDSVPVGRYAKAALTSLGVWDSVSARIVRADNVRSALQFVARGEAPFGIVYATDALVEKKVRVVDTFPANSHPPIIYPAAATSQSTSGGARFVHYLEGSAAQAIFRRYGFTRAPAGE
jgi:molybdate transport system substrate-binding protein